MKYHNPIIKGFNPDPSICRVDRDYYLVTSSFEYFPGIPIYHSRDLVNWKQIGNCITDLNEFHYENTPDSGGIWAPSIRYENGRFYVTATFSHYGNFIISTADLQGEWSHPIWISMGGIDPSVYFENGHTYYCTNQQIRPGIETISMCEIDIQTGNLLGETRELWQGIGGGFLEAPHIYKINNWYYLMTAEGGTEYNHMITLARSREIIGPYESCPWNPILTNIHDTSRQVQCSGHGDLVQDHQGNWWVVHLAVRAPHRMMSHLGRETFLTPVIWKDDWLYVQNKGKASLNGEGPLWEMQNVQEPFLPDFYKNAWEPEWVFLRNRQCSCYHRGNGILQLFPAPITFDDKKNPTFIAIRQRDLECTVEAEFDFEPEIQGDEAGIAILLSSQFYYRIGKKATAAGNKIVIEKNIGDLCQLAYEAEVGSGRVKIKVQAEPECYQFSYAIDEQTYQVIGNASTKFLSSQIAGKCFTGTMIGLYAFSPLESNAVMEIVNFISK